MTMLAFRSGLPVPRPLLLVLALALAAPAANPGAAQSVSPAEVPVAVIVNDPSNAFWFTEGVLAKRAAQRLGYQVTVYAHSGDVITERDLIRRAIDNDAVAVLLDPAHRLNSRDAVQTAMDQGVRVLVLNAPIERGMTAGQFGADNLSCARRSAAAFARLMGDTGRYVQLDGPTRDANATLRAQGFASVLDSRPGLERVRSINGQWSRETSYTELKALVAEGVRFDGIIAANDEMALGALEAVRDEIWAKDLVIGGFDGSPDALRAIELGTLSYTVVQPLEELTSAAVAEMDRQVRGLDGGGYRNDLRLFGCDLVETEPH
ncbi:substrate-binding domain-containing protein [Frigidibacter sp. MR17.24]|uniref:substrate-binding domain-containing protein n=1 Tax=Frigidibacter sp. MR17.24 TaxID=3127345 RepID=UPI0030131494